MLCVIPHISKYVFDNYDRNNMKQVKNVIKFVFHGISYEYMNDNFDTFWSDYNYSNNKNGPIDGDDFIWRSNRIQDGNIHLWN